MKKDARQMTRDGRPDEAGDGLSRESERQRRGCIAQSRGNSPSPLYPDCPPRLSNPEFPFDERSEETPTSCPHQQAPGTEAPSGSAGAEVSRQPRGQHNAHFGSKRVAGRAVDAVVEASLAAREPDFRDVHNLFDCDELR